MREAFFSVLGDAVQGASVADLFAGTGAVGLGALSRGAASAEFFESARGARSILQANLDALAVGDEGRVVGVPLPRGIGPGAAWDLVYIDPPWGKDLAPPVIARLLKHGRLAAGGQIWVEERAGAEGSDTDWRERGLKVTDRRRYGDAALICLTPTDASIDG